MLAEFRDDLVELGIAFGLRRLGQRLKLTFKLLYPRRRRPERVQRLALDRARAFDLALQLGGFAFKRVQSVEPARDRLRLEERELFVQRVGFFAGVGFLLAEIGELCLLRADRGGGFERVVEPQLETCDLVVQLGELAALAALVEQQHPRGVELIERALSIDRLVSREEQVFDALRDLRAADGRSAELRDERGRREHVGVDSEEEQPGRLALVAGHIVLEVDELNGFAEARAASRSDRALNPIALAARVEGQRPGGAGFVPADISRALLRREAVEHEFNESRERGFSALVRAFNQIHAGCQLELEII